MFRRLLILLVASISVLVSYSVLAQESAPSFRDYVHGLKQQAVQEGYKQAFVDSVFQQVKLFKRAHGDKSPELKGAQTLEVYLPNAIPKTKSDHARELYKQHYVELKRIGDKYGVQPRFILAFWGVQSNFGEVENHYPVLSVLASFAFEGTREAFYRDEFFSALEIIHKQDISFTDLSSSRDGEMGKAQFLPSSYLAYAQDGDNDDVKDIWTSTSDTFASIAFYLQKMGWNSEQTWGRQVKVSNTFDHSLIGISLEKSLAKWQELGVRRYSGADLPAHVPLQASLIAPDGPKGRFYLVYENYRSLQRWQDSDYFAISVAFLSEKINYPKIKVD